MRERLIESIKQGDKAFSGKYAGKLMSHIDEVYEFVADYILADGWIRLPCKVGDILYKPVKSTKTVIKCKVLGFWRGRNNDSVCLAESVNGKFDYSFSVPFEDFGKTVFPTKEEAEKALKEGAKT